jgi:ABC-type sugar transport system ATPase subunit
MLSQCAGRDTHGIYLVPEDRRLSDSSSTSNVRENITVAESRELFVGKDHRSRERSDGGQREAVKAINIKTPTPEMRAANLSGGNQQKVGAGEVADVCAARIDVFDEPTRGIDVGAKAEIYQLIRNLASEGVA